MAKRRKRRSTRSRKQDAYPGWLWMMFGLAIGLSVAFAVYVNDRNSGVVPDAQPASLQDSIDNNASVATVTAAEEPPKKRFDFYDILPAFEIVITEEEPDIDRDVEPQAIDEPGIYLLQAGSFSTHNDADRRRAELALHGIESHIQRAKVNGRDYHRVYVGPTEDLEQLNILRSRLRAAKIDVLRIRLGD